MISRRHFTTAALIGSVAGGLPTYSGLAGAQDMQVEPGGEEELQLIDPPIESIDQPATFGYKPATPDEIAAVDKIISETKGSTPYEVALSFVRRFYQHDRDVISQWPAPAHWNPLIVRFFRDATSLKANNDMVDWCAAFVNWCVKKAGKHSTNSAASQSFLSPANKSYFKKTSSPQTGNLVVFTCFDMSGRTLGLGHVGFYVAPSGDKEITVLSGNTAHDGRSSLICIKPYTTMDRNVYRTVKGRRVPCVMKLNSYMEIV
jgi:uncharacterized protein (TIGR02594 family)